MIKSVRFDHPRLRIGMHLLPLKEEWTVATQPLKSVGVPPSANLWPDWYPQKRVNRDKLDQR